MQRRETACDELELDLVEVVEQTADRVRREDMEVGRIDVRRAAEQETQARLQAVAVGYRADT